MKKKIGIFLATIFFLTSTTSCSGQPVEGMFEKIFGSWQSLVIQLIATFLMIVLVGVLLFKPVREVLTKRKEYIANQISAADSIVSKAKIKEQEADARLDSIENEAKMMIEQAKKNVEVIKDNANKEIEQTKKEQHELLAKQLEQEKEKAKEEIRKEIVNVALEATSAILEREVNESDNSKIVEDFIKDINTDE
ncbi:MAG: hypothetical protein PUA56_05900 [Bacillales bacterium]|nr:hypothetical protein [Bacillales bacterium]